MTTDKNYALYGTRVYSRKTKEIGLRISTWVERFAGGEINHTTCVDSKGNRHNIPMDDLVPPDEMEAQ